MARSSPQLHILRKERGSERRDTGYRGITRNGPPYAEQLPADHVVNRLFAWYCSEGGQEGIVNDCAKAKELLASYRRYGVATDLDLVEEVDDGLEPVIGGRFLGYDMAYGPSLLSWGMCFSDHLDSLPDEHRSIEPLIRLVEEFFVARLNANGLFDDLADARFFLDCMAALQDICPGLWDSDPITSYYPMRIFLVDET